LIKFWIFSDFKKQKGKKKKGKKKKEHGSPTRSDSHTCDWSLVRDQMTVF
jgi:hypothetical protein